MKKLGMLFVVLAASCLGVQAAPDVLPADERWTENTSVRGEFGWGNYEGTQTAIGLDTADKKAGNASVKYSGIRNAAGGVLGPSLVFPQGKYLDISALAGGKLSFDLKLGDAVNFQFLQLVLMSDGVQANQISRNLQLQPGWNHVELPLAAAGKYKEAGWSGQNSSNFNPAAIHQIRFRFIYQKDKAYDSATPRDIWIDALRFTAPETTVQKTAYEILEQRPIADQHKIAPGQSWKVELPKLAQPGARLLRVTVRRQAKQLGGYGAYLYLAFNGEPLDAAKNRYAPRLLNKPLSFMRPGGQEVFWNRGDGIWQTIFAPSFETDFKRYGPDVAEPYTYLLDVTDLAREAADTVELGSYFPEDSSNADDVSLVASVDWIAAKLPPGQEEIAASPVITARPNLTVTTNGALALAIEGKTLLLESEFSVPGGGRNSLGGASHEPGWQPKVTRLGNQGWRIEAAGKYYRLVREVRQSEGRIAVRDTLQNIATQDVGIIFSNALNLAQHPGINYCRIGGQRGQGINEVNSRENPTLFFPLKNSSLTMVAEDDVYRNQATFYFDAANRRSGIRDSMFALAPQASHTFEWSIYTLPGEKYLDAINRIRSDWQANITLRGPVYFTNYRSIAAMSQAQVKELVDRLGARYICFWEVRPLENQPAWGNLKITAEGPGIFDPVFQKELEMIREATAKLHAAHPEIKVALYSHSFFISPEKADDETFRDSWITNAQGKRSASVYDNAANYPYHTVFPTTKNSYGKAYTKVIDFYFNDLKLDWLYWDESNGPGVTVEQGDKLESYLTYNAWDGYSARIDPQTGLIQQKCGFLTLLSNEYIHSIVERVKGKGGFVLFNGSGTTQLRRQSPAFVESQWDITRLYSTHLNTPLAYGLGKPTMTDLRRRLDFGTLYARTHLDYSSDIVTKFYPFTPLELHEGWVKGKERIVTNRPGSFGWEQPFKARLYLYDGEGKLTATRAYDTAQKTVSVTVPEGGIAILERVE